MKSPYSFIVKPKTERSSAKKNIEGKELILNTELQNHQYVSRHGVVLSTPLVGVTPIVSGDEIIVHHNVFRRFYDVRGNEKNSKSYFRENMFLVDADQIFAYKGKDDQWKPIDGFYFVKPLKNKDMFSADKEMPLKGIIKYGDSEIPAGTLVGFAPRSEYEFIIEEERLYRVPKQYITIKYEYQGDEEEYNPSWTQSS